MNSTDPKLTVLQFNEYINRQDINGLSNLMTDDHLFVDREGNSDKGKESMTKGWIKFFEMFPEYRNTFIRLQSQDELVVIYGYAVWNKGSEQDYVIWTVKIENDLVAEWRIYEDTEENKKRYNLI
jgi:ketosteroid isomerase-like protein